MIKTNKEDVIKHIGNLANDYKRYNHTLSYDEALELDKMISELKQLQEYHKKWVEMTDILRDENGNRLELGDNVDFKVNVTDWGSHRNGIDPSNLEKNGDTIIAKMTGTLNFDMDGRQFCIDTDYYFLPSIYVSCIEEGSLQLHIGKDLEQFETNEEEDIER